MKPYPIQMLYTFFPSLTYTHHFSPTIFYIVRSTNIYYILFCNRSISSFISIASSISPLFIHLTYLLFKFLILVLLNTFSCCLFIKNITPFYSIASANNHDGSYANILPSIHQLQVIPLPLSDKTQAGSR